MLQQNTFEEVVDNFSVLHILYCIGGIILTFIAMWLAEWLLEWIFRDILGWQYNARDPALQEILKNSYLMSYAKQKSKTDSFDPNLEKLLSVYVDDKFKKHYHGPVGYLRNNVFLIFYLMVKLVLFGVGTTYSFKAIGKDIISLIYSLGFVFFVSVVQLGDYFRQVFAFIYNAVFCKIKLGDSISLTQDGSKAIVIKFSMVYTTTLAINPYYDWDAELKKKTSIEMNKAAALINVHNHQKSHSKHHHSRGIVPDDLSMETGSSDAYKGSSDAVGVVFNSGTPIAQYSLLQNMGATQAPVTGFGQSSTTYFKAGCDSNFREHAHRGYEPMFIEWQIPNYTLVFGNVFVYHI
jgi:hypothetical protein